MRGRFSHFRFDGGPNPHPRRSFEDVGGSHSSSVETDVGAFQLTENDSGYQIRLNLSAVDPGSCSVELQGNRLTVSGQRAEEWHFRSDRTRHVRRERGSFQRSATLAQPVDATDIKISYIGATLQIDLAKQSAQA